MTPRLALGAIDIIRHFDTFTIIITFILYQLSLNTTFFIFSRISTLTEKSFLPDLVARVRG